MMHVFGGPVPKMMFVCLPLMALLMLPLYHSLRRYDVEHLVFLLHVTSTPFLTMIVGLVFSIVADVLPALSYAAAIGGAMIISALMT